MNAQKRRTRPQVTFDEKSITNLMIYTSSLNSEDVII